MQCCTITHQLKCDSHISQYHLGVYNINSTICVSLQVPYKKFDSDKIKEKINSRNTVTLQRTKKQYEKKLIYQIYLDKKMEFRDQVEQVGSSIPDPSTCRRG